METGQLWEIGPHLFLQGEGKEEDEWRVRERGRVARGEIGKREGEGARARDMRREKNI